MAPNPKQYNRSGGIDVAFVLDGLGGPCLYPCRRLCNMRPNRSKLIKLYANENNYYCKG